MSWFEDWFNSPLYEKLYVNRDENEASLLADLIEKEIPKNRYPNILDLGCGRGRHSITLAQRGYRVTGIDLSENAIRKARQTAEENDLSNVQFQVRDMRNPLPQRFDAIVNLFTTFGYFLEDEENSRVLQGASGMLNPGGIFMLDYLNANYVRSTLVPSESGSYGEIHYEITRKIENQMVFKTIEFSGKPLDKPVTYQERVKLYPPDWFREQFKHYRFELIKTYGNYRGDPFETDSKRLLMIAKCK